MNVAKQQDFAIDTRRMAIIETSGRKRIHGDTDAKPNARFYSPAKGAGESRGSPLSFTAQRTLVQDDRTRFLFRIDDRAAGPVLRRNLRERGESAGAFWYTESATRLEGAARRHGVQRRTVPSMVPRDGRAGS